MAGILDNCHLYDYPTVALVPIVSNLQSAQTICETWHQNYQRLPDALILEHCKLIGGHFASQCEELDDSTYSPILCTGNCGAGALFFLPIRTPLLRNPGIVAEI